MTYGIGESLPGHGTVVKCSLPLGRTLITVSKPVLGKPFRVVNWRSDKVLGAFATIEEAIEYFHAEPGGCEKCMVNGDIHT
jgi:hypothetical protein